jgi:tRNA-splicing ligase RtcB (3'-phosphate/5'-hydroxy nucleic acid ligase)
MSSMSAKARIVTWLAEPLPSDVSKSLDRLAGADDVQHVAVMPDVHLAHDVCIGTVVATSRLIYPAAIGGDIGCGMTAVRIDAAADLFQRERSAAVMLAGLYARIPTNRHSAATMALSQSLPLPAEQLSDKRLEKLLNRDGRVQFGTLGRGNHFLEFQADQDHQLWLMVHSGSRAMGQAITAHHLRRMSTQSNSLPYLEADSDSGAAFLGDVKWALHYAEQNRLAMVESVAGLLQDKFAVSIDRTSLIQSHHNHVQLEQHFGNSWWVHRKGAQSARADEPGIVPGSMGTASFHVSGRNNADSLHSSSHGAGQKLSRTEARRAISTQQLDYELESVWFDQRRVFALRDEAPTAYKGIHAVMRAQKSLIRITRELRPLLSYKGR